jgi:hypothetical protein
MNAYYGRFTMGKILTAILAQELGMAKQENK